VQLFRPLYSTASFVYFGHPVARSTPTILRLLGLLLAFSGKVYISHRFGISIRKKVLHFIHYSKCGLLSYA
jgi:hypothetical protein